MIGSGSFIDTNLIGIADKRWSGFLPPAPTGVTARAGNAQSIVSWTAPTVLAQTPVTRYLVQYSTNSGSTWTTFGLSATTSATVTSLTNGTSCIFRVAAINAIGTGAFSSASSSVTIGVDTYFSSVSLLMHFEGSGNTFTDSSGTPKAITAYGNATQSTAQYKFGSKSGYFDGSGDYLQIGLNAAFGFGTGDFTLEYWHYPLANSGMNETHIDLRLDDDASWLVLGKSGSGALRCYDGVNIRTGGAFNLNAWNYVAWVRSSGTNTLYLNGSSVITFSNGSDVGSTRQVTIGSNVLTSAENTYGYLDELRATKGVARTIAVPTQAFLDQ